jgi:hypothetical protein
MRSRYSIAGKLRRAAVAARPGPVILAVSAWPAFTTSYSNQPVDLTSRHATWPGLTWLDPAIYIVAMPRWMVGIQPAHDDETASAGTSNFQPFGMFLLS